MYSKKIANRDAQEQQGKQAVGIIISSPWRSNLQPAALETPAAASKAARLAPTATPAQATVATASHLHDEVSPSSEQPAQKLKGGTGTAMPKPRCLTQPPTAAAAAGGGGGSPPLTCPAKWQCSSQTDGHDHAPVDDYFKCGTALVRGLLKSKSKSKKEAPQDRLEKLKQLGDRFRAGFEAMEADSWLQLSKLDKHTHKQNSKSNRLSMVGHLNYGGKYMATEDWDQVRQSCPELCRSSELKSDDSWKGFHEGYKVPALHFECKFNKDRQQCYVTGSGLKASYSSDNKEQHATEFAVFRNAVFEITVVLLLLWHAQGRQQHPALQQLAEEHGLGPVRQQQGQVNKQTNTQIARIDGQ